MFEVSGLTAAHIMMRKVVVVRPEESIRHVAKVLAKHGISGVPVIDESNRLVGMISEYDLLRQSDPAPEPRAWWLDILADDYDFASDVQKPVTIQEQKVSCVMTRHPVSVLETTPVREIANLLVNRQIKRVPVLRDGQVVGIVSRGDLMRVLASE